MAAQHEISEADADQDRAAEFQGEPDDRPGHVLGDFRIKQARQNLDVQGDGEVSPFDEFRRGPSGGKRPLAPAAGHERRHEPDGKRIAARSGRRCHRDFS